MTKHNHIKDREKKFSPYIMDPNVSSALVKKGLRSCVMVHKLGAASNSQQWQEIKEHTTIIKSIWTIWLLEIDVGIFVAINLQQFKFFDITENYRPKI
jgi:hypothetical protein